MHDLSSWCDPVQTVGEIFEVAFFGVGGCGRSRLNCVSLDEYGRSCASGLHNCRWSTAKACLLYRVCYLIQGPFATLPTYVAPSCAVVQTAVSLPPLEGATTLHFVSMFWCAKGGETFWV